MVVLYKYPTSAVLIRQPQSLFKVKKDMKGVIGIGTLVAAVFGVAVLVGIAQLTPTYTSAITMAIGNLSTLGIGGSIGALVLGILAGLVVAIGLAKLSADVFGVELGI